MAAPVPIAHTHVHSLRLRSGAEALVARVVTLDGVAGYGFCLELEAAPARDMAAWDALARSRQLPLYALFGEKRRETVAMAIANAGEATQIDPFELGSIEAVRSRAAGETRLLAPNAHAWEIGYCAALAATLEGDARIALGSEPRVRFVTVPDTPGIGVDWSIEPAFAGLRW